MKLPDRGAEPRMKSYEDERAGYRVEVPERFNPVLDIIERWCAEDPDAPALVSIGAGGELVAEQSVSALAAESRRMARALMDLGVGMGDRVLVMLPRVPAWYTAMLGAIRIGAVPIPTPNLSTATRHQLSRQSRRRRSPSSPTSQERRRSMRSRTNCTPCAISCAGRRDAPHAVVA